MGNVVAKIQTKFLQRLRKIFTTGKQQSVTMIGLDAAGKTTLLYFLKTGEVQHTVPTLGFNCESVEIGDLNFLVWDIGGQEAFVKFWQNYIKSSKAIIFLVDVADSKRYSQASYDLWSILKELPVPMPLLVLVNKIDLIPDQEERSRALELLNKELNLNKYEGPTNIVECSVTEASGGVDSEEQTKIILNAFQWLSDQLKNIPA
ncbi:ADP-ribosylation factor [Nosema bombycis CQ1]|uniref:ADP-ribosylation factor n=1 Tax=Nosema bombycis (strain CQ1 / CVCC 102059) TaxID=578461 RepID=R0KZ50_NOSB1|nr:ADP-ribosylation factor [Nosema bombycis CQ1]|eukprot:EOB15467.1 ADP-ribosylation factor [Nosema bombycis CQ1]